MVVSKCFEQKIMISHAAVNLSNDRLCQPEKSVEKIASRRK